MGDMCQQLYCCLYCCKALRGACLPSSTYCDRKSYDLCHSNNSKMILLAATSLSERIKMKTRSCSYDSYFNCILPDLVMVASESDTVTSGRSSLSCSARVEPIP